MIRRYLPYKQEEINFKQQKWVRPYTITRVYDDNTIQIENIYQKDLGRWESSKCLPYDCINPNQVITSVQKETKTLTSPDYGEVHQKMLECYFIQPMK